ncbi:MAG: hypothetical protein HKL95_09200, partial [Phycisphaerae bacterium]|nr:hypothetical protein [Phycisphaerae bacterium]
MADSSAQISTVDGRSQTREVVISSGQALRSADSAEIGPQAKLTDYIDPTTLQDIQDALASVAQVKATILDPGGQPLTQTTVSPRFETRSAAIAAARHQKGDADLDQPFSAPIIVGDVRLGSIVIEPAKAAPMRTAMVKDLSEKLNIPAAQVRVLVETINQDTVRRRTASVQFLHLLADALSRLCQQEILIRRRLLEISTLFNISTMLTGTRGLQQTLDRVTSSVVEAMGVKAASLRLLDGQNNELRIKSVCNLSDGYLQKGPILLGKSAVDREALTGAVIFMA